MLKVHLLEEFFLETFGEGFNVHVVAVTSALAAPIDVLLALCVEEVSHWRKDSAYFFALEKSAIDVVESVLGILLIAVFNIYVSHDMVAQVVNDNHILDFSVLTHLFEYFQDRSLGRLTVAGAIAVHEVTASEFAVFRQSVC